MRGAVLAGGAASRFDGKPKGLEKVGGERILDRVVRAMRETLGTDPILLADPERAGEWDTDLDAVPDPIPERGSLSGLYTATALEESPVLVVAWDMPFVIPELLTRLIDGAGEYDAFLPISNAAGTCEPMCAVYGPACVDPIKAHIDDEDYRATGFHDDVRTGFLPFEQVETLGEPATLFFNVNTPADLTRAEELWRARYA